jgi:hypothetical protein
MQRERFIKSSRKDSIKNSGFLTIYLAEDNTPRSLPVSHLAGNERPFDTSGTVISHKWAKSDAAQQTHYRVALP